MATVKFYLKNPAIKGILRTSEVSIIAKFSKTKEERFELPTDERIVPRFWDKKAQVIKTNAYDHININLYLQDFKRRLITLYRENKTMPFSQFKTLARNELSGRPKDQQNKKTFAKGFRAWLINCRSEKDPKTLQVYMTLLRQLRAYKNKHDVKIDFDHLDWNFYDAFRNHLYDKGLIDASVNKSLGRLKAVLTWLKGRDYPVNPTFEKWKWTRPYDDEEPLPLTIQELELLEGATDLTEQESIGRDYLCLEARTGQRISDISRFDIRDYENLKWTFYRKKGGNIKVKRVTVHFVGYCAPALCILIKHNFQLPKVNEQDINDWIKLACEKVGITQPVYIPVWRRRKRTVEKFRKCDVMSTHTGRRTFITLALQFMPPKIVMDLTGINSYNTLKRYEAKSQASILQSHLTSMDQKLRAIS